MVSRRNENHRNLFPAVQAAEGAFHRDSMVQQVLLSSVKGSFRLCGLLDVPMLLLLRGARV
jgi:hypothetical protein